MDLQLALNNLVADFKLIDDLQVITDGTAPGARNFTLSLSIGPRQRSGLFGLKRVTTFVALTFTSRKPDLAAITAKLQAIEDAVSDDPRRGGNAQTSYIGPEWTPEEDFLDREGVPIQNYVGVVTYED